MNTLNVCLIGNGVSSYYFLYLLNNYVKNRRVNIKWIYSSTFFPRVDSRIWPIITLNGIKKGINELGDQLFEAYHSFEKTNNTNPFASKVKQYMLCDTGDSLDQGKFIRRHEKLNNVGFYGENLKGLILNSFFVKPDFFFNYVDKLIANNPNVQTHKINSLVTNIYEQKEIFSLELANGNKIETDNLFVFSGVGSKFLPINFFEGSKTHRNQVSQGKVFNIKNNCLNADAFILSHDKKNIVYDGVGSIQTNIQPSDTESFIVSIFEKKFGPLFEGRDFSALLGLRDKASKRLPQRYFYNKNGKFLYKLSGLYKNAWTIAIKEVDDVLREWLK